MHDQKIDVLFCSLGRNARRNINPRTDARDPARIFDLETIKRIVPIAYVANPQEAVGITDDLVKRSHEASVKAFVPNAEAKHMRSPRRAPLHHYRENHHAPLDPADLLRRQFLELEQVTCSIAH